DVPPCKERPGDKDRSPTRTFFPRFANPRQERADGPPRPACTEEQCSSSNPRNTGSAGIRAFGKIDQFGISVILEGQGGRVKELLEARRDSGPHNPKRRHPALLRIRFRGSPSRGIRDVLRFVDPTAGKTAHPSSQPPP